MRVLKISGIVLGCIVLVLVIGLVVMKFTLDAVYFKGYDPIVPLNGAVTEIQDKAAYTRIKFYFDGWRGERVPGLMAMPKNVTGKVPCVLFLPGIGQEKDFMDDEFGGMTIAEPFTRAGFAFATFDQYMRGERKKKYGSFFEEAQAFRLRPAFTVNDARRLIDYLQTLPDIAPTRIFLAGASYGAITGATIAAFDRRIPAVALVYGGGNIRHLLHAKMVEKEIGKAMIPAQIAGWLFLEAADPAHYVGMISPRPVLLQNGADDCLISTPAAKALQEAAKEPKTIKIYPGDHIGFDKKTVVDVLDDVLKFFKEQDAKIVASEGGVKAAA